MGGLLSTSSDQNPNPSSQPTISTMPSSNPSQTHYSSSQTAPTHQPKTQEEEPIQIPEDDTVLEDVVENKEQQEENEEENEEEEEEEGECGFCLFMKGGDCKDVFIEWENCVLEGEMNKEDVIEKCQNVTKALKECLEAHPDYYGPVLAAEAESMKELEREKKESEGSGSGSEEMEEGERVNRESGLGSESGVTVQVEEGKNSGGDERKQSS